MTSPSFFTLIKYNVSVTTSFIEFFLVTIGHNLAEIWLLFHFKSNENVKAFSFTYFLRNGINKIFTLLTSSLLMKSKRNDML